jgi:hypothetical protein
MTQRHAPPLTPAMMNLAAELLDRASEVFANHGCNDQRIDHVGGFETREARAALDLAYHRWNGDPQEHQPDGSHDYNTDFALMSLCAASLRARAMEMIEDQMRS